MLAKHKYFVKTFMFTGVEWRWYNLFCGVFLSCGEVGLDLREHDAVQLSVSVVWAIVAGVSVLFAIYNVGFDKACRVFRGHFDCYFVIPGVVFEVKGIHILSIVFIDFGAIFWIVNCYP